MENWLTYIFDFFMNAFCFFLYVSAICKGSLIFMQCCHEHNYIYGHPVVLVQCTSFRYPLARASVRRHHVIDVEKLELNRLKSEFFFHGI